MVTPYLFGNDLAFCIQSGDVELRVCELGAALVSMKFAGQECVLGYDSPKGYEQTTSCIGLIVGRYANRIARGEVVIGGETYRLDCNDGRNHLHGGNPGFHRRRWKGEKAGENAVRFTLYSPAGEGGYPGNVEASVTYAVENGRVRLSLEGMTDAETLFAPTTHAYFNFTGERPALGSELAILADYHLPVDGELIPTGELAPVEGSRYDFRTLRPVAGYYDDAFVLRGEHACTMRANGMEMEIWTDYPALQIYSGEGLTEPFVAGGGIALEPEVYPDSPHHADWPQATLRAGEKFQKYIEYRFHKV